jgi:hypothetical protein
MNSLNTNVTLNIEFKDLELLSKLNYLTAELSISLNDFIIISLHKLISDIQFTRNLRNYTSNHLDIK